MKSLSALLLFVLATLQVQAGTNLLDLLKAGKAQYNFGSCKNFIQQANHKTLKSPELQKLVVKSKDSLNSDGHYFHYTNSSHLDSILIGNIPDRKLAQAQILKNGGYKSIIEYQMTYPGALGNVAGVGFYLAGNPWSSKSYGSTQVIFKVSPEARTIDYVKHGAEIDRIMRGMVNTHAGFSSCLEDLRFSLLMNENDIDLVHYNQGYEWFVAFNEDIFIESAITNLTYSSDVIDPIVSKGYLEAIVPYIAELRTVPSGNSVPISSIERALLRSPHSSGKSGIALIADAVSIWDDGLRNGFASYISSKTEPELSRLISDFKAQNRLSQEDFLRLGFDSASQDFIKFVGPLIKSNPDVIKNWGNKYAPNMAKLLTAGIVDLDYYLSQAPVKVEKSDLYFMYRRRGFEKNTQALIEAMISQDPTYFKSLSSHEQVRILQEYLRVSTPEDVPRFVSYLKLAGPDWKSLGISGYGYNFVENLSVLQMELIKQINHPSVIHPSYLRHIFMDPKVNYVNYLATLKLNPQTSKELFKTFFEASLEMFDASRIDQLISLQKNNLLSKDELHLLYTKLIVGHLSASFQSLSLLSQFTTDDYRQVLLNNLNSRSRVLQNVLQQLKADSVYWSKYIDLNNQAGVVKDITLARNTSFLETLRVHYQEIFYRPPYNPGLLRESDALIVFSSGAIKLHFDKYDDEDKMRLLILGIEREGSYYNSDMAELVAKMNFSPTMVKNHGDNLVKVASGKYSLLHSFANNISFIQSLPLSSFDRLMTPFANGGRLSSVTSLSTPGLLDFDRALSLALNLRDRDTSTYNQLKSKFLVWSDLTPAQKKRMAEVFLDRLPNLPAYIVNDLWKEILPEVLALKEDQKLLKVFGDRSLAKEKFEDLAEYYLSNNERTKTAISGLKSSGYGFVYLTLTNPKSLPQMLSFIERNYPIEQEYITTLYRLKNDPVSWALAKAHLQKYSCKRVKGFKGFDTLIANADRYYRRDYKAWKKEICN